MDLSALRNDVLSKEPAAALPCNLSDVWLDLVAESLEQVLDGASPESGQYLAGPLALVLHLLFGKLQSADLQIDDTRLLNYLCEYQLEVALEKINRHTNVQTASATLETIFTNRLVTVTSTAMISGAQGFCPHGCHQF